MYTENKGYPEKSYQEKMFEKPMSEEHNDNHHNNMMMQVVNHRRIFGQSERERVPGITDGN